MEVQIQEAHRIERKSRIAKRSIVINGHKTSLSVEDEFWEGLKEIAAAGAVTLGSLVQKLDSDRETANLSSAVRLFVLNFFIEQARARTTA